jgi:ankyrin repeat protein
MPIRSQAAETKEGPMTISPKSDARDSQRDAFVRDLIDAFVQRARHLDAFLEAARWGYLSFVRNRLDAGQQPDERNDEGVTALMLAASGGNPEVVELLIAAGANVNAANHRGFTPLLACMAAIHPEDTYVAVATLLISAGADVSATSKEGLSVLELARQRGCLTLLQKPTAARDSV